MQPSKQESNISVPWSCRSATSSNGSTLSRQIPPSFPKILRHFKGLTQWVSSPRLELLRFLFSCCFLQVLTPDIFLS